ncbi:MAG: ACT domain-containing protein [Burkholderiaceae bacterium]
MNRVIVAVIGLDSPGVVYTVSTALSHLECNIEEMSQTTLKNQFASIFLVSKPAGLANAALEAALAAAIAAKKMHLSLVIRDHEEEPAVIDAPLAEPFVVAVDGHDRNDIITSFSGIFAEQGINIDNLRALKPEGEDGKALLVFEVSLPLAIDRRALHRTLADRAASLGLAMSMQHRDIFEAVHRVLSA